MLLVFVLLSITIEPTKTSYGLKSDQESFWDGSVVYHNNTYHLFASRMSYGCGLDTWQTNSECIHAVSSSPYENFTNITVVVDSMCHNPSIIKVNNTFFLFYIGMYEWNVYKNCSKGRTDGLVLDDIHINPCFIRYKTSLDMINWSRGYFVYTVLHIPFCPTNPAPFVVGDKIELLYRAYMYSLSSGSFGEYIFRDTSYFWAPFIDTKLEDPSVVYNDGVWIMFANNKFNNDTYVGTYGISRNLTNWNFYPFYNLVMTGLEDVKIKRRERPFVLLLNTTHGVLYNSILEENQRDHVYIQSFPIRIEL